MQVLDFLKYKYTAGNAHGLHSPFIYHLYTQIIEPEKHYYVFDEIEEERQHLLANNGTIEIKDLGAGSKKNKSKIRSIQSIAKYSLCSPRTGRFLFELIHQYKYKNILELGTSLGISTCYLCSSAKDINVTTIEGCPATAQQAQNIFHQLQFKNIRSIIGNIDSVLPQELVSIGPLDLVYFDANHTYEATIKYFELCLPYSHENTLFVFDDIYWSNDMKKAWSEIRSNDRIGISVDLYELGLCFFRKKQPKQHFTLQF
ncbi:O-methyltransferase [Flammeovirga pacifica]|uniref:SAM-dependent methyltransferase n=1 Tax=Flammeovirga pacifica TaxID=915059 RepID=A0A1S1YW41_FLAPC|nr:class I SAM-dependent methyltransferase [Flammeovirga pacifica]OHX65244.1 SAM-dependent methyltransferase [Flammeovirga pacifica]